MAGQLVVVVGATGTGKSELSVALAERLVARGSPAEIVNADAMQLYRGMDIGTAKLTIAERRGIPHHMLDTLDPIEEANVAAYQIEARTAITGILDRGSSAILVGGSGLYVSSVIFDFRFPGTDPLVRAQLESELASEGPGVLYSRLSQLDPIAAQAIGAANGRRLVRALEVIAITGSAFGAGLPDEGALWRSSSIIGLKAPRDTLVTRIDARVRRMWEAGLVGEARTISSVGLGVTASRAIGYAQALAQLAGQLTEGQAIEQTAALTRRYARRQVGWFRRYAAASWLDFDTPDLAALALATIGQD